MIGEDRIDQKPVAAERPEEGGMPEPYQPRLLGVTLDEFEVGIDERSRWTGRTLAPPVEQTICDAPAQDLAGPVRPMVRIQVRIPMGQRSILSAER
jgi:hypothetical protein